ncbi:hypothetical protein HanPI659440_Chr05g0210411 [Helianthus annuus]|nr:hypothetical protein HanPI659440_Chr05g0210411 [Helianthus annuus]
MHTPARVVQKAHSLKLAQNSLRFSSEKTHLIWLSLKLSQTSCTRLESEPSLARFVTSREQDLLGLAHLLAWLGLARIILLLIYSIFIFV